MTFPSGIQTSARDVPVNQVLVLEEPDLARGSCPLVFSWNGERFEFITDAISAGIIGEPVAPGSYWTPDPDEWLRIGGESLRARGRFLDIRFVNALEEVAYLDRVRLMAADHPAGSAVYPDEKMVGEPSHRRPARLYVLKDLRGVAGAIDQRGQDVTKTLQDVDRRYFDGFQLSPFKGFTEDWSLTLDLGSGSPGVLLLHGWTAWNSSASALAAHQAGKTAFGPVLDVQDRQGSWRVVRKDVGVPAGLPRAMLVDLREVLREGERVVRIRTNRTVHFDQALVADVVEVVELTAGFARNPSLRNFSARPAFTAGARGEVSGEDSIRRARTRPMHSTSSIFTGGTRGWKSASVDSIPKGHLLSRQTSGYFPLLRF